MSYRIQIFLGLLGILFWSSVSLAGGYKETSRLDSADAIQGAASFGSFVFAVNSRQIAKYDRQTGQLLGLSNGEAIHLNSGFVWRKQLLCAHSNYPMIPERSQIMKLDPGTMALTSFHDFDDYGGSLTWIVRRGNRWLCNFAKYGENNQATFLVEFDSGFKERHRWTYPPEVVNKLGKYSLSGGVWARGELLVTGHDANEIYVLHIPKNGGLLKYVTTRPVPFTGQGFAIDKPGKGLIGISRAEKQLIFVESQPRGNYSPNLKE